jgi:hypothetical protein
MVRYLVKTTEQYRIDASEVDLKEFQEKLKEDAERQGYMVTHFSYTEVTRKDDEWYRIKVVKEFEKESEPDLPLKSVSYERYASFGELDGTDEPVDVELGDKW